MKKIKENKFFVAIFIFLSFSILTNLILTIISKGFNIDFFIPKEVVEGPLIFYTLNIGHYHLDINQTIVNTWVLILILGLFFYFGTKNLSVENPSKKQIVLEEIYKFVENMFVKNYGEYKRIFMPFFTSLLLIIGISNLSFFLFPFVPLFVKGNDGIEVTPFFRTATADINTTVGLAIVVLIIFIGAIIRRKGFIGFIKELCQPFIFMFPINLIGELAKPINISIRLFGNMIAGLVILAMIYSLNIPHVFYNLTNGYLDGPFSIAFLWPIFLQLYLDLFVGSLQAFVFTMLSSVYIEQCLIGPEEE